MMLERAIGMGALIEVVAGDDPSVAGSLSSPLASSATLLTQQLHESSGVDRWSAPAFVREVELVRTHLRLIRTEASLLASFGREALQTDDVPELGSSAVLVAYAIRWLELQDGVVLPAWGTMLGPRRSSRGRVPRVGMER